MPLKIRLSRGGNKKRPHYRIVLADSRAPRDGRFIERLGTYNPLLSKDNEQRIVFNEERIKYWLKNGAKPSDRITKFLSQAKIMEDIKRDNPNKAKPKAKAQERAQAIEDAKVAAEEEKAKAEAAPAAEEAPAAEAAPAAEEAPAAEAAPAAEEAP
ncbi:MAG: 30S ribosomal protein S16, partial [Pelagibacterales bacterium]|nr:30S ribosomal protein S16 [Pelagibacterales bacterium]